MLAHGAAIWVLFVDIPIYSIRSSGQLRDFGLLVARGSFQAHYHHTDSVFGERCELLWFHGTVVRCKRRNDVGIHPLGSVSADVGVSCSQVS